MEKHEDDDIEKRFRFQLKMMQVFLNFSRPWDIFDLQMKKIGFIDCYIDEWHANNYPAMIRNSELAGEFELALAWEESAVAGKKPIDEWCREHGVGRARSAEEVVDRCDCLVVLSPDNPERHEALADLPLRSGKPVYVDKPFAPTRKAAERLFRLARDHRTPLMTSSALRFAPSLTGALKDTIGDESIVFAATRGPGKFELYAIHQLEMLVMALGTGARRVMQLGNDRSDLMAVDYGDGRRGTIALFPGYEFAVTLGYGRSGILTLDRLEGFFEAFIGEMLRFFLTGHCPFPPEETLEVVTLLETGIRAFDAFDNWVDVAR